MDKNESTFQKYLLCESTYGAVAKKDTIATITGYLETFHKDAIKTIRDRLEHVQRVDDYTEIGDAIEEEIKRMNAEYVTKFTEFLNVRKF
jgi:hypothetical protein